MPYFWDDMTDEARNDWFRYFTPEQFLSWLADKRLPDRCEDPATIARLVAVVAET